MPSNTYLYFFCIENHFNINMGVVRKDATPSVKINIQF